MFSYLKHNISIIDTNKEHINNQIISMYYHLIYNIFLLDNV